MSKNTNTAEEKVVYFDGVSNLKELNEEKARDIVKNLAKMNPNVMEKLMDMASPENYIQILNAAQQFLNEEDARKIVGDREAIRAYRVILDGIEKKLSKDDLSEEEHHKLVSQMLDVASKIGEEERKKEQFDKDLREQKIIFTVVIIVLIALSIVAIVLAILTPGFILDILLVFLLIALFLAIFLFYKYKKKELKRRYKANNKK